MSSTIVDPSGPHSSHRLFEWDMALILFLIGVILLFWPNSIASSRFSAFVIHQPTLTILCLAVSIGRGVVLFMNGRFGSYSAKFRAIASFLSALIWSQLAIALILSGGENPSIGIAVYGGLAVGELRSIWRAARDHNGFFPS